MRSLVLLALCAAPLVAQTPPATEGIVVDAATGAPIAGASVSVSNVNPIVTRTDVAGHFRLESVGPVLQVARSGYVDALNVSSKFGQDLTIRLAPAAAISGKVEDQDGFPVYDARVEALRYRLAYTELRLVPVKSTKSNELGEYRLGGLPPGSYYLRISSSSSNNWDRRYVTQFLGGTLDPKNENRVEVKMGEQRTGIDIPMLRFEGVTVRCRVEGISSGSPNPNIRSPMVQLQNTAPGSFFNAFATVQKDGSFVIPHVPPGHYKLTADTSFGNVRAGDLWAETALDVETADIGNLTLTLRQVQEVDVAGTVVVEGGGTPPPMQIWFRTNSGGAFTANSESKEDGSFVLKGLLPGHYDLQMIPRTMEAFPTSARLGDREVLLKGFDIDSQPVGAMKITLSKPIAVTGTLVNAAGQPLAGQQIVWISDRGGTAAITDSQGQFKTFFRSPGDYHVYLVHDQEDASDPDYLAAHAADFPIVTIRGANPPLVLRSTAK
jgi:hypothetical protein